MISGTITDASGRTLSGQVTEAFWNSVRHARPLAVGLNCALGAERAAALRRRAVPHRRLLRLGPPQRRAAQRLRRVRRDARGRWPAVVGEFADGRAGQHRRRLLRHHPGAHRRDRRRRRPRASRRARRRRSRRRCGCPGSSRCIVDEDSLFVNVGERTNITGSARFRNLIKEDDYDTALGVARQQVEAGAQVIDVNMDEGMIDGVAAMDRFLKLIASEPDICRVPLMIDSSQVGGHRGRPEGASRASRSSTRSR